MTATGQVSFTSGNIMKLILVMVAAIGFVAFLTSQSGGFRDILQSACETNPDVFPFCADEETNTNNKEVALHSSNALVCAINSVAEGENLCTRLDFEGDVDSRIINQDVDCRTLGIGCDQSDCIGDGTEDNKGKCYDVLCGDKEGCQVISGEVDTRGALRDAVCKCSVKVPVESSVECGTVDGDYRCTVSNFTLLCIVLTVTALLIMAPVPPVMVALVNTFLMTALYALFNALPATALVILPHGVATSTPIARYM